jgi:hypothetical protein
MSSTEPRVAVLDDAALGWAQKALWTICIAVYLIVFIGGIRAGGAELVMMGRAAAFTVTAAVLGRMALGLMRRASLPVRQGPMADLDGPVGSLVDMVSSTNVAQQLDEAEAAVIGER